MPQAFISYSRRDAAFVSQLQTALQAAHFDTWRDVHSLRAGDRWPRKLGDAINAAPVFILVWSANAAGSDFVELEWTIAVALKRTLCIVALDQIPVPATLKPYEIKRTVDSNEAARWLLNNQSSFDAAPSSAAAGPVLQKLAETSDDVSAKQLASNLTITFISQAASTVHGGMFQAAGPMTVNLTAAPSPSNSFALQSNIPARGKRPFVGRQELIAELDSWLQDTRQESAVVLHGAPGVGKSELARLRRSRYPGGTFAIDASANAFALQLASLGEKLLALSFPPEMPFDDRGLRTFLTLSRESVLLIYDNVVSFEQVQPWMPYSGTNCHILITTLLDRPTHTWPCVEVNSLTSVQSLELVDKLSEGKLDHSTAQLIATHSGGLPVQILPHAAALIEAKRRSRKGQLRLPMAAEAGNSFRAAYSQLERSARLLLHAVASFNTQQIPSDEITQHLMQALDWSEAEVERAFDGCYDLHLLENPPDPRMHQLFAEFIRETPLVREDQDALSEISAALAKRFVELATRIWVNPADLNPVKLFLDYPLTPEVWSEIGANFILGDGELVGSALVELGRFKEARTWFERAVAETEKGDVHGLIDHRSLSASLHWLGYCYSSTGRFDEARPWFERAAAEKEKGDVHGRIDQASLGSSLHQVGHCYSSTGRFEEALPWYERAVAEKEKGDVHGRVNHESLGTSLHLVGYYYSSTGRFEEALPWFERAVAKAEKGDVHGRVDHESLGISLYQVGYCYGSSGRFEEALPWFRRAVTEAEKGDIHGRVQKETVTTFIEKLIACLRDLGRAEEADQWEQRSAQAAGS